MHDPKFRKLVVFTDSRQDVAKLSAGIELDHYRDVVRQSMVRSFTRLAGDVHAFLKSVDDPRKFKSLSHEEQVAYRRFTENNKDLCNKIRALQQFDDSPENLRADKGLRVWADGPYRLSQIDSSIKAELLALGCNPAGPWPSLASDGGQHVKHWYDLYDWDGQSAHPKDDSQLLDPQRQFRDRLDAQCLNECVFTLFAHARKSVESLRLGWVTYNPNLATPSGFDSTPFRRAVEVSIRLLGEQRRFRGSDYPYTSSKLPGKFTKHVKKARIGVPK